MTFTIVFDLDDTLYLERDYVASGLAAVSRWLDEGSGITGFHDVAWRLWQDGQRTRTFDEALVSLGLAPDAALIAQMLAVYRSHPPTIALQADALRFLSNGSGFRRALVTDGPVQCQRAKIAALDLAALGFDPMICTDQWGKAYWKPHCRAFQTIARQHGPTGPYVYVADNPAKDFLGPRSMGWRTVQIDRPGAVHARRPPSDAHRADLHIASFEELDEALLDELAGRSAS